MPNYLSKCLGYNIFLLCLIVMIETSTCTFQNHAGIKKLSHIAKRSFLFKEHEFLKVKPLSSEMKSFISKYKKRAKSYFDRSKRDNVNKDHMYVVQNGDIIPLENLTSGTAFDRSPANFTVIPLIIPITVKNYESSFHNHLLPHITETMPTGDKEDAVTIEDIDVGKEKSNEGVKGTSDVDEKIKSNEDEKGKSNDENEKSNANEKPSSNNEDEKEKSNDENGKSKADEKPRSNEDENGKSNADEKSKSNEAVTLEPTVAPNSPYTKKEDDAVFLNKVLEDVQELVKFEKEGKSLSNEGALCSILGDWDSDAGGMQLRIVPPTNNNSRWPDIQLVERDPQVEGGFLCDGLWNITGHLPFNHSSVIVLTAVSNRRKRVATFVGECRICEGTQTITGDWMIGRGSRNCKDRQESHSFFSDVLRKSNIRKLQEAHLEEIHRLSTTPS